MGTPSSTVGNITFLRSQSGAFVRSADGARTKGGGLALGMGYRYVDAVIIGGTPPATVTELEMVTQCQSLDITSFGTGGTGSFYTLSSLDYSDACYQYNFDGTIGGLPFPLLYHDVGAGTETPTNLTDTTGINIVTGGGTIGWLLYPDGAGGYEPTACGQGQWCFSWMDASDVVDPTQIDPLTYWYGQCTLDDAALNCTAQQIKILGQGYMLPISIGLNSGGTFVAGPVDAGGWPSATADKTKYVGTFPAWDTAGAFGVCVFLVVNVSPAQFLANNPGWSFV